MKNLALPRPFRAPSTTTTKWLCISDILQFLAKSAQLTSRQSCYTEIFPDMAGIVKRLFWDHWIDRSNRIDTHLSDMHKRDMLYTEMRKSTGPGSLEIPMIKYREAAPADQTYQMLTDIFNFELGCCNIVFLDTYSPVYVI